MSRYKKKVPCPTCLGRMGWEQLVETRADNEYTYHCKPCDWYWRVSWFKDYNDKGRFKWNFKRVQDDFGHAYDLL